MKDERRGEERRGGVKFFVFKTSYFRCGGQQTDYRLAGGEKGG